MESINSIVLHFSRELQLKNKSSGKLKNLNEFKEKRQNAGSCFHFIFEKVVETYSKYDIEIKKPRLCNRQKNCSNIGPQRIEDYYRITFYVLFLDTYICHLQCRFEKHKTIFHSFGQLFLKQEFEEEKCTELYNFNDDLLDCSENDFVSEVKMWRQGICDRNVKKCARRVIEFGLFEPCKLENIPEPRPEDAWEYKPCQKKFVMRPEDEISLDSIFSALLSIIEPTEAQFRECQWDVAAKDMHNEKQSLLFEEKLYISQVKTGPCKLNEENKIFLETELDEIGYMKLNIEESYDGYVVFSRSQMTKGKSKNMCGHCLRGKYNDKFLLIVEKRSEFDYIDKSRIEKNMEARNKGDSLLVIRETKINADSQKFKTEINIKDRVPVFIMDGGIQLLMRYLIINNFVGDFEYYTMNIFGKVLRGVITVDKERKKVRIFYRNFTNVIVVKNFKYFNDVAEESSETLFTSNGKIVLHFWPSYNYLLHAIRSPPKPKERILPKLELMWKADNLLFKHFQKKKKLTLENATSYLQNHPEVVDFIYDYILSLLKYKPDSVFAFTIKFFQNMKNTF